MVVQHIIEIGDFAVGIRNLDAVRTGDAVGLIFREDAYDGELDICRAKCLATIVVDVFDPVVVISCPSRLSVSINLSSEI